MKTVSPQKQLDGFLARFTPQISKLARSSIAKMRVRLPGAIQMVYDNYNALVVGFCPNDRPSDGIFSIAIYPQSVALCFLQGAGLADPKGLLQGSGSVARHIRLEDATDLDDPRVKDLVDRALKSARVPLNGKGQGKLVIRSISTKQRPRRPAQ